MKQSTKEELRKFLYGLLSTAMGVLIALLINSIVNRYNDKDRFDSMLKAINIEAIQNKTIYSESFIQNFRTNIVRREFSTKICDEFLVSNIFLDNASPNITTTLIDYSLTIKRANSFRASDEKYKYDTITYRKWSKGLTESFARNLGKCDTLIDNVIKVTR